MKKILGILFIGSLWCNVGIAVTFNKYNHKTALDCASRLDLK